LEKIIEIAEIAKLDAIQLHGEETPEFAKELKAKTNLEIIKAFRVSPEFKPENVLQYEVDAILLDAYSPKEHGGTGETFDWEIANEVQKVFPRMYLAGGLSVQNVEEAIAFIEPYAVDACSCLEITKGVKDFEKVKLFLLLVRKTDSYDKDIRRFVDFVRKDFRFLETDYDFRITKIISNLCYGSVRYESKEVCLNTFYHPSRYEHDVALGLLSDESQNYTIGELLSLTDDFDTSVNYTYGKSTQIEMIEKNVSWFASILQKYGAECLKGNVTVFRALKENREKASREYTQEILTKQTRQKAEVAWKQRDYVAVRKSYSSIEEFLSPAEKKKLEYAERMK